MLFYLYSITGHQLKKKKNVFYYPADFLFVLTLTAIFLYKSPRNY